MEPDRYKQNSTLYVIGIICLVLTLGLLFFILYITPFLIWKLSYDVPSIVADMVGYFEDQYDFTEGQSKILLWLIFFIPMLITGYISYYVSNRIDNQIYRYDLNTEEEEEEKKLHSVEKSKELKESMTLGLKILCLMVFIVIMALLLQLFVRLTA